MISLYNSVNPELQVYHELLDQALKAQKNRGLVLYHLGLLEQAEKAFDWVVKRFESAPPNCQSNPDILVRFIGALENQSVIYQEFDKQEEVDRVSFY